MQFAILATSNPGALEVRDEPADAFRARAHDHREHSESRVQPVSEIHRELRRKGVTLALLWQEYKGTHPGGLQYSWFCEQFRAFASQLDVTMRQEHRAGEKILAET